MGDQDKNKRGGHRSIATKLIREIQCLLDATALDQDKIKAKVAVLNQQKTQILHYDDLIQIKLTGEALESDMEDCAERMSDIFEIILKAESLLETLTRHGRSINTENNGNLNNINLPKIVLPFFSGNIIEWPSFWDAFNCAIHERSDIAAVQKLAYFSAQLKGEASQLLSGFPLTNDSYLQVIELAKETFGRPQRIITAHLHSLFDLPSPSCTADDLRKFRSAYECNIRSLRTLGTRIDEAGFVISALLARKLPTKIKDNINRATKGNYFELSDFRAAIDSEIEHLQTVSNVGLEPKAIGFTKPYSDASIKDVSLNVVTTGNTQNMNSGFRKNKVYNPNNNKSNKAKPGFRRCQLCHGSHSVSDCTVYMYANLRIDRCSQLSLCKKCLLNNHATNECKLNKNCSHCGLPHHYALCLRLFQNPNTSVQRQPHDEVPRTDVYNQLKPDVPNATASTTIATTNSGSASVALPIALVPIITNAGVYNVRALLDGGSQRTFIRDSAVTKLSLKSCYSINLTVDGFCSQGIPTQYDVVQFEVATLTGTINSEAIVVDQLPNRIKTPGLESTAQSLKAAGLHLADPGVTDVIDDIMLLIGSDQYYNFVKGFSKVGEVNLLDTNLGSVISGKIPKTNKSNNITVVSEVVTALKIGVETNELSLNDEVRRLWTLDSIGITDDEMTKEERLTLETFDKSIFYKDGHYVAKLPWRAEHPPLPTNYSLAKARLISTCKKLNDQGMVQHYDEVIKAQLENKFIERVETSDLFNGDKIHYLPHHGVKKDSPTTPLRIVMCCNARLGPGKPSLNDCLYTGPSLIHELMQVLLRFRLNRYAAISDIAKAFHMIALDEKDRDATRFLWLEDPNDINSRVIVYRYKVVLFGATCSQFLLNATIKYHLKQNPSVIASLISDNIYVDNLQSTFNSESDIISFYHTSKSLLANAGLSLREWDTNSPKLQTVIYDNKDGTKGLQARVEVTKQEQTAKANVLGMHWDTESDFLGFPVRNVAITGPLTKRAVLRSLALVFDPLGIITPITIRSRVFMQTLWKTKVDWDEHLNSEDLIAEWDQIQSDSEKALSFSVPRAVTYENKNVGLHVFSDASSTAYGAVIYLSDGVKSTLLISKARVSPLKTKSITRLELLGVLLAARLVKYVTSAYKNLISFVYTNVWTDSQVVLRWLASSKPLEIFVRNRVNEIKDLLPNTSFHYVSTKDNPADLVSRGLTYKQFVQSKLWREGPSWLNTPEQWPQLDSSFLVKELDQTDIVTTVSVDHPQMPKNIIIDLSRFSSFNKLINVTILVLRFINKLFEKIGKTCLKCDANAAETVLIKQVQQECYSTEAKDIKQKNGQYSNNNLVNQLNLFLDGDIIRSKGRLEHSNLNYNMKNPILLPSKHFFAALLITDAHTRRFHSGVNDVVAYLRQRWWIPSIRQRVKNVLQSCMVCRKLQGKPFQAPPEAPLPAVRVQEGRPFQTTGVDYTGALTVKSGGVTSKAYIALFTCAVTRAIHLELVNDNSSEAFLFAFRRFVGRRSTPLVMISDNSSTFVSSAHHLQQLQSHPGVIEYLAAQRCQWKFIPSRSPWMGGFWERLIASTKMCLKKSLGRSIISPEELRTLIIEVESSLNDRPLTYSSSSLDELEVLTPAHLMYGYRLSSLPYPIEDPNEEDDLYLDQPLLTKRQLKVAKLIESFWERWRNEYLTALRENNRAQSRDPSKQPLVGDVVLIYDDSPRLFWKLAIITEVHPGIDGFARSAKLKTNNGTVTRSVKHLYPLEINSSSVNSAKRNINLTPNIVTNVRPKRKTAENAQKLIKEQV